MPEQSFIETNAHRWQPFDLISGTFVQPLAEPVPQGSIHKLRMVAGTVIPVHQHPVDEYVYVLSGTVQTGEQTCEAGTFWVTPAHTRNGPHCAMTDVELLTIRLGAMGEFEPV
jgi:quercetin dioxygenase-like cupin family protein